jgi:hypothetical protein
VSKKYRLLLFHEGDKVGDKCFRTRKGAEMQANATVIKAAIENITLTWEIQVEPQREPTKH